MVNGFYRLDRKCVLFHLIQNHTPIALARLVAGSERMSMLSQTSLAHNLCAIYIDEKAMEYVTRSYLKEVNLTVHSQFNVWQIALS